MPRSPLANRYNDLTRIVARLLQQRGIGRALDPRVIHGAHHQPPTVLTQQQSRKTTRLLRSPLLQKLRMEALPKVALPRPQTARTTNRHLALRPPHRRRKHPRRLERTTLAMLDRLRP